MPLALHQFEFKDCKCFPDELCTFEQDICYRDSRPSECGPVELRGSGPPGYKGRRSAR